jgi:hypothetical protein
LCILKWTFGFHKILGNFWVAELLADSQEWLSSGSLRLSSDTFLQILRPISAILVTWSTHHVVLDSIVIKTLFGARCKVILKCFPTIFGLESRKYGRRNPSRWPRGTLYPKKVALTSLTSGGLSVGTDCWQTQATEFFPNYLQIFFHLDLIIPLDTLVSLYVLLLIWITKFCIRTKQQTILIFYVYTVGRLIFDSEA